MKRVLKVPAILLIHDTANDVSVSLSDVVVNEAPWQCVLLQHDSLLQLINGVKLPAVVDSLLQRPQSYNLPNLNPGCWGTCPAQCR